MWSNADEVEAFILEHKDRKWEVGDFMTLPDIEQRYTVVAVRPFRHRGDFRLFIDLEAECAVEGCEKYLLATKEVHQWRMNLNLPRCCAEHRYQFRTPMGDAWRTAKQRAEVVPKKVKTKPEPKAKPLRVNEQALASALEMLGLVTDRPPLEDVVRMAARLLPKPKGVRDTRRQVVVRVVGKWRASGKLVVRDGCCVLA